MSSSTSAAFESAVAYLSSYRGGTSQTTMLELYGLFKYVKVAPSPTTSRPGLLDFAGKAKWDAWSNTGKRYKTSQEAQDRYIEIATSLGWQETVAKEATTTEESTLAATTSSATRQSSGGGVSTDEEDIWDKDEGPKRSGGGLGVAVSALSKPLDPGRLDTSLHDVVLKGDAGRLRTMLELDPTINLDEVDEYGYTPLHLASDRGHLEVVRLLLERGANKTIKDADEFTPQELAEIAGKDDIAALLLAAP